MTAAAKLRPLELRTLDAIHVATALSLAPALTELITYGTRLASAPRAAGLSVDVPRSRGRSTPVHRVVHLVASPSPLVDDMVPMDFVATEQVRFIQ